MFSLVADVSEYSAGPASSGRPASTVSDGFDDNTRAHYVPDQRTQLLLNRMRETVKSLTNKIHELQDEESTLRAENSELVLSTCARVALRPRLTISIGRTTAELLLELAGAQV